MYREIGEQIKERRKYLEETEGITLDDIHSELAEKFGRSISTVRSWRCAIEKYGILTTTSASGTEKNGQGWLNRLSFYLGMLGFEPDDFVIQNIKGIYNDFEYPLPGPDEVIF